MTSAAPAAFHTEPVTLFYVALYQDGAFRQLMGSHGCDEKLAKYSALTFNSNSLERDKFKAVVLHLPVELPIPVQMPDSLGYDEPQELAGPVHLMGATTREWAENSLPEELREEVGKSIEEIEETINAAIEDSGYRIEIEEPGWLPSQRDLNERYFCGIQLHSNPQADCRKDLREEVRKALRELGMAAVRAEDAIDDPNRPMELPPCPGWPRYPQLNIVQPMNWLVLYRNGEFVEFITGSFHGPEALNDLAAKLNARNADYCPDREYRVLTDDADMFVRQFTYTRYEVVAVRPCEGFKPASCYDMPESGVVVGILDKAPQDKDGFSALLVGHNGRAMQEPAITQWFVLVEEGHELEEGDECREHLMQVGPTKEELLRHDARTTENETEQIESAADERTEPDPQAETAIRRVESAG